MAKKVVLAYSGGLDTSVAVRWMIENLGCEVICVSANVGQEGTLEGNREKALGAGASCTVVVTFAPAGNGPAKARMVVVDGVGGDPVVMNRGGWQRPPRNLE